MEYGLIFALSVIFLFTTMINMRSVRIRNAGEENLRRLGEYEAIDDINDAILKNSFKDRMESFFHGKVDELVIKRTLPSKKEELEKLIRKVYKNNKTYKEWEYERMLYACVSAVIALLAGLILNQAAFLLGIIALPILFYKIYETDLRSKAKAKDWENFIFFPELLMSICMLYRVGAVSTIFQAFKRVTKIFDHPLIDEINIAVNEYEYNKDKYDILNDLSDRVDFKEFTSFINLIVESEKNNIPIVDTMLEYAFEISNKRKILATNQILKLPDKLDMVMYMTSTPVCFIYMIMPSMKMALSQLSQSGIM